MDKVEDHLLIVVSRCPPKLSACRLERRSLLAHGVVQLTLLLPAPGLDLSTWGGVVLVRGQEHLQRELLMPPVRS